MYRKSVVLLAFVTRVLGSQGYLDGDFNLAEGVKLVSVPISNSLVEEDGRSFGQNTAPFRMAKFLQGHELHVKLPSLVEKEKLTQVVSESLKAMDETYKETAVSGRGKGGGGTALLGLMFAKGLGALGIGGIALLTMKALGAAALALLLAAVVGAKKLTSHDDHDDHQVIYAGHHGHHRRKRDLDGIDTPLPYKGWAQHTKRGFA